MPNLLDIQNQQRQNIIDKIKQFAVGGTDAQTAIRTRVSGILSTWDKAGKGLKETVKAGINETVPNPIIPGNPALTAIANIPSVAIESAGELATDLVPARPAEVGATLAAGPVLRGTGKLLKAGADAINPNLSKRVGEILQGGFKTIRAAKAPAPAPVAVPLTPQQQAISETATLTNPTLNIQRTKEVVSKAINTAITAPEGSPLKDQSKRVFRRISDALGGGEIMPENIPAILKQNNISPQEFANLFVDTMSTAGKQLSELSRYAKQIGKYLPEDAAQTLKTAAEKTTAWDKLKNVYRAFDNPRRALAVTQFATAARNFVSQGARYSLQTVEDVISGAYKSTVKGEPIKDSMRQGYEDVMSAFRRMSPKARAGIDKILDDNVLEKTRITSNMMGDLTLGNKVLSFINTPNRVQETFFRKMALDSKLNTLLSEQGKSIATATNEEIGALLPRAVDHALTMTFSATPKNGLGKAINTVWREMPLLTTVNPFPRFWANSVKFLTDYSPLGFARMFSPDFVKQMASKNGNEAYQALAKAQVGTLLYAGAFAVRNSPMAGQKWYEIKVGENKYIDARPYAPFSTYLFIVEAMKEAAGGKGNLTPMDYAQGILSINRISGTGLALIDWMRATDGTANIKSFKQILGQYVGTYTVPFRTASDIIAGTMDTEEKYVRDTTTKPLSGPALSNIPGISRKLPYARSIFKTDPVEREKPLLRQGTGFGLRTKNDIETEIDRLGISTKDLLPKTGDAMLNLQSKKIMGKLSPALSKLINSESYKKLEDIDKTEAIKEAVAEIRQGAVKVAKVSDPKKALILSIKQRPANQQKRAVEALLKGGKYKPGDFTELGINLKKLGLKE